MGKKVVSRCGQLVQFLELMKRFFCEAKEDSPAVVQKYEIDQLINYLNTLDDDGPVTIKCEGITFRVKTSNMDPKPKIKGNRADVNLSMKYEWLLNSSIRESLTEEEKKESNVGIYDCNIRIKAIEEDGVSRFFSWHLDCEENINGKFVHPHFHFHAGGRKISGLNTGRLLMLSSPRIAYPPMDLPLAVNFVIRNFVHRDGMSDQYAILNNIEYKNMVKQSENYILKPYFKEIYEKIGSNENRYFPVTL